MASPSSNNDLFLGGLVKVKEKFDFAEMGARPVCLYTGNRHEFDVNIVNHTILVVAGYGKTMPEYYYKVENDI